MDAQLHEAVERAIKISMERVSESAAKKIVQHAADRTNAIVEDARKAVQSDALNLDAKVRQAVQEAVAGAAEHAAQEATRRANELNIAQAVEAAVEKAIQQKEAINPFVWKFCPRRKSPTQQHLDQWKNDLEQTAQGVRSRTIEQTQEDAAAAAGRDWKQEMRMSAVSSAAQSLQEKLSEAAHAAFLQTEQEIAARNATVRSSLDEAIVDARSTIESLGAGLAQQLAQTEEAKSQFQDAAKSTVEQTRAQLDSMAAAHSAEMARKADEAISQRAQQIEPISARSSTQNALQQFLRGTRSETRSEAERKWKCVISELSAIGQQVSRKRAGGYSRADSAGIRPRQRSWKTPFEGRCRKFPSRRFANLWSACVPGNGKVPRRI